MNRSLLISALAILLHATPAISQDLAKQCQSLSSDGIYSTLGRRFANEEAYRSFLDRLESEFEDRKTRDSAIEYILKNTGGISAWEYSRTHHRFARRAVLFASLDQVYSSTGFWYSQSMEKILGKEPKNELFVDYSLKFILGEFDSKFKFEDDSARKSRVNSTWNTYNALNSNFNLNTNNFHLVCASLPEFTPQCSDLAKETAQFLLPKDVRGYGLPAMELVKKILLNPAPYLAGIQKYIIQNNKFYQNKSSPDSHLFQDLEDAFVNSGVSKAEAKGYAWDVIGFVSTRSVNLNPIGQMLKDAYGNAYEMEMDFSKPVGKTQFRSLQLTLGLAVVLSMSSWFDWHRQSIQKDRVYTIPPEVKVQCDTGKWYHFWMNAYTAYRPINGDLKSRVKASFMSSIAYHMLSNSFGRDPLRAFKTKTWIYHII
jgi:hypothetical protein